VTATLLPSASFFLVVSAMRECRQLHFVYDGFLRCVCPHSVGWSKGLERVIGFQFAGFSPGGLALGGDWRCFDIQDMRKVSVRDGEWHTGLKHFQPRGFIERVHVDVDDI